MHILPQRSEIKNREAERVGAVLSDHVERVGGIPERLAHLPPLGVADDGCEVNVPEWHDIVDPLAHRTVGKRDRKSTRLNSSHGYISYAVFCLKKKKATTNQAISYLRCSS